MIWNTAGSAVGVVLMASAADADVVLTLWPFRRNVVV